MTAASSASTTHPARIVLIGTPPTIASGARMLRESGLRPLGSVVLNKADAATPSSLPILGTLDDLDRIHANYPFDVALVSLPAAMGGAIARVRTILKRLNVAERFLPTLDDVLTHEPSSVWRGIGEIDFAALTGRPARRMDHGLVESMLKGKRVLITGAGGSIGSEIARICASFSPSALLLMERSDNALFEIDRQIAARFPDVKRQAVLHDVVDAEGTLRRLVSLRPDVVFHAAAHKHVPLMEDHPAAAVNNNLFGTKSVADAALAVGAERFVLISTDKAVNPTSVMGATKRLAELYVRSLNDASTPGVTGRTRFSLVRFGNVLGSACSVLPIWSRQIAEGGPVTVTHPEMTRYFMTIPEAAALVIQAGALGRGGSTDGSEVFILDMGEPIRIVDLARRYVEAHGLTPQIESTGASPVDPRRTAGVSSSSSIRVVFSGIRAGEKLHEELAYEAEELARTNVDGVFSWSGAAPSRSEITGMIAEMSGVRASHDREAVLRSLQTHVPEMVNGHQSRSGYPEISPKLVVEGQAA